MVSAATGRKSIVTRKDVHETAFRGPLQQRSTSGMPGDFNTRIRFGKIQPLSFRATHSDPLVGSECEVGEPAFANLFRRTLLRLFRLELLPHPFLERLHVLVAAQEVVNQGIC